MSDVESYLSSKGMTVKRAGADNVHVACPFCNEPEGKRGRLYVNVSPDDTVAGLYHCKLCDARGNLRSLRRFYGDPVESDLDDRAHIKREILRAAAEYYAQRLDEQTFAYLTGPIRGLEIETIERHQIGYAPRSESDLGRFLVQNCGFDLDDCKATGLIVDRGGKARDFLSGVITIPYHVQGAVVQIRGKDLNAKYVTPPGQKARLFNIDAVWGPDEVYVTEGEFDALVLEQNGYPAIASPGANTWQDSWTSYFEDAKRVWCVFDNDTAGNLGADKLGGLLTSKFKRIVLPVDVDVTDYFNAGATVEAFEELKRDTIRATSILVTPSQALEEWRSVQGQDGFKFGMQLLDVELRPGLLPGQVCIPLAKTNTGKTLFLLNLMQRAAMVPKQKDVKFLFVSLEQTRGEWFERAMRIHSFYNLEPTVAFDFEEVKRRTVDFWTPRLRIIDKNRVSEAVLIDTIHEYQDEMGHAPDVVCVDYLGYWAAGFSGASRYERVGDAVMSLKAVAKEERIAIISPHQVSRVAEFGAEFEIDKARDSGAIEETADLVFALWSLDNAKGVAPDKRTGELKLKIGKSRADGKGKELALQFGAKSLVMVPASDVDKHCKWAREEMEMASSIGVTWQQAQHQHRSGDRLHLGDTAKEALEAEASD